MKNLTITIFSIGFFFFLFPRLHAQSSQTVTNGGTTLPEIFPASPCIYSWTNSNPSIGLPESGTGNIAPFTAINTGNSPMTATITATPVISYSYVPGFNSQNSFISVIDINTKQVNTKIPLTNVPDGIEVNHAGTTAYICSRDNGIITVLNTATDLISATINVGGNPVIMLLSPDDSKLYVANSPFITIIDTKDNSIIAKIPNFFSGGLALSPDGSKLYISLVNSSDIYVLNTASYGTIAHFKAGFNGYVGTGLTVSHDGNKLFVTDDKNNNLLVIGTADYSTLATIPLNACPGTVKLNDNDSRAYVVGEGSNPYNNATAEGVVVINTANYQVISNIAFINQNLSGLSLTPDGSELYLITGNGVTVINTNNNLVEKNITGVGDTFGFGDFITPYLTCGSGGPVKFTITVEPSPVINAGIATGNISSCQGTASVNPAVQQFTVSGVNLTAGITATVPPGFELSLNADEGYTNSLTLPQSNGIVNNTTIYVRSSATATAGNISGNVVVSSTGAINQSVAVIGLINASPVVNTPLSQKLLDGSATAPVIFTGIADTYSWTNDTPAIGLAASGTGNIPSFNVINNTSGALKATITVTPLNSAGCDGLPAKFTIIATDTATLTSSDIPNTFTPNNDNLNDTWVINSLVYFPRCSVNVYNRWGQKVFTSVGYPIPWNGEYKGKPLPSGTYYYIVDPKNGQTVIAGWVEIIR
jgi:gliding motility-associated-like protein